MGIAREVIQRALRQMGVSKGPADQVLHELDELKRDRAQQRNDEMKRLAPDSSGGSGVVSAGNQPVLPDDAETRRLVNLCGMTAREAVVAKKIITDAASHGIMAEPGWDASRQRWCIRVEGQNMYSLEDARLRVTQIMNSKTAIGGGRSQNIGPRRGAPPPISPPPQTPNQPPVFNFVKSPPTDQDKADASDHHAAYLIGCAMRYRPQCLDYQIDGRAMENLKRTEPAAYEAMMQGMKDTHSIASSAFKPTTANERLEAVKFNCELIGVKFGMTVGLDDDDTTYQVGELTGLTLEQAAEEATRITQRSRSRGWSPPDEPATTNEPLPSPPGKVTLAQGLAAGFKNAGVTASQFNNAVKMMAQLSSGKLPPDYKFQNRTWDEIQDLAQDNRIITGKHVNSARTSYIIKNSEFITLNDAERYLVDLLNAGDQTNKDLGIPRLP